MTTSPLFWDRIAPKYSKSPIKNLDGYHATLARTRSYLRAGDRVAELGCGTGSTALLLADAVASYLGTDVSEGMISIARKKLAEDGAPALDFEVADADAPLPGAPMDVVMAFNLLHLVDNLTATLDHIRMSVRDGGLLIAKTPCLGDGPWIFRPMIKVMQWFGKAPHALFFTRADLERAIMQAGFQLVEADAYPSGSYTSYIVARAV